MQVKASALSLTVADVAGSVEFFTEHLGYRVQLSADGFVSLDRDDAAANVVFLRQGLEVMPQEDRDRLADGLILAFVVDDLDDELARLQREGVTITLPLRTEAWGERLFQVKDPNGVIVQLMDWVEQN